ncbi:hypothetical protein FF1_036239 [Malus domestica]
MENQGESLETKMASLTVITDHGRVAANQATGDTRVAWMMPQIHPMVTKNLEGNTRHHAGHRSRDHKRCH